MQASLGLSQDGLRGNPVQKYSLKPTFPNVVGMLCSIKSVSLRGNGCSEGVAVGMTCANVEKLNRGPPSGNPRFGDIVER